MNEKKKNLIDKLVNLFSAVIPEEAIQLKKSTQTDGTVIEYAGIDPGTAVNVIAEDGTATPCVDGEYVTEDGILVCKGGTIAEVKPIEVIEEAKKEEDKKKCEEQLATETKTEEVKTEEVKVEEVKEEVLNVETELAKQLVSLEQKLTAQASEYEIKLSDQKKLFEEKIIELSKSIEKTKVILNDEPFKPLSVKEQIMKNLGKK